MNSTIFILDNSCYKLCGNVTSIHKARYLCNASYDKSLINHIENIKFPHYNGRHIKKSDVDKFNGLYPIIPKYNKNEIDPWLLPKQQILPKNTKLSIGSIDNVIYSTSNATFIKKSTLRLCDVKFNDKKGFSLFFH